MKWVIDKNNAGLTIREYLQAVHGFSRRIIIAIKQEGKLLVNDRERTVRYVLSDGDVLEVHFPAEKVSRNLQPEDIDLNIAYEDEAVIVIDKPAGIAAMPSLNHRSGTMANGLIGYYRRIHRESFTVHVVTRLDRDTSGLVLVAKDRYNHSLLSKAQQLNKIKRTYIALVEGHLEKEEGTIDAPIARKTDSIIERTIHENGKRAVTHYKKQSEVGESTMVEIELETGRTHQIRVHFSHYGHPLVGDDLYGGSLQSINRQALHCYELMFEHPITKESITIQSELPKDMQKLLEQQGDQK
ncbi:RluA family pseudouridine synthase [Oceanobacillus polygoni]|uniref:Pseudouridine synthase n=1 Tax=Oceanobacillus polygoni TaxID=1235259 RepID=A0A9X0YT73_9BACI|nr:RluA family pseudouridine synthase [Oceanobacillus polygoni]MBP2076576.1 23S rRNA pseudouridine1911/1915/1917 synthase [Oceanobacillus polygoni]